MPRSDRCALAAKGAVLWVLLACLAGLVPALLVPNDATFSLPWLAAGMGIAGAFAHVVVVLTAANPSHTLHTGAAIVALGSLLTVSLAYWLVGSPALDKPSLVLSESLRALVIVVVPMALVCTAVLRVLLRKSAA
jgi:hypothetical protein